MTEFVDAGREYRRGVILGLSLAELFTILVFLLLLVLGAYALVQEQTLQDKTTLADAQRDVLVKVMGDDKVNPIEPALPGDLKLDRSETEELRASDSSEGSDALAPPEYEPATSSEAGNGTAQKEDEPPNEPEPSGGAGPPEDERPTGAEAGNGPAPVEDRLPPGWEASDDLAPGESPTASEPEAVETVSRQQRAIDGMTRKLAEQDRLIEMLRNESGDSLAAEDLQDKLAVLETDNASLQRETADFARIVDDLERENRRLENEIKSLADDNATVRRELADVDKPIGQDSPCWFADAERPNGKPYERPAYIFHVRITDGYIYVHDVAASTDAYRNQKLGLAFDRSALGRPLSDAAFVTAFRPLKQAGEDRLVREDRRCTFYVAVWDATSETNKRRYKRAHNDVVQAVFNTYEYRADPWPHG